MRVYIISLGVAVFGLHAVLGLLVIPRFDCHWISILAFLPEGQDIKNRSVSKYQLTSELGIPAAPACCGPRSQPTSIRWSRTCSSLVDLPQDYCIRSRNLLLIDIFSPQSTQKYYRLSDFILIMKITLTDAEIQNFFVVWFY